MLAVAPVWFPILDAEQSSREIVEAILEDRFVFNGEEFILRPGFDWTANPSHDIEWQILLHKFYYAPGLGAAWRETGDSRYVRKWMELTGSWIAQVPAGMLPSDVAGRRIQNWISAWHYFADAPQVTLAFRRAFLDSLQLQVKWLRSNLTPARNHRTLELLALFLAAVAFPDERGAGELLEFAKDALADNLGSDIRPDGVHCEQSTDYHHIVLRNALIARRLADLNGIRMPAEFDAAIRRALEFALFIHRPDGLIPSLSDGDTGSYLSLLEQGYELYRDPRYRWVATAGRAGSPPRQLRKAFPDGGYYILRSGWGETERFEDERFLVFDCGPLGDGNHGHLDLLSFELYGSGRPLIVDPGRYTYDESGDVNWRVAFRGTAYHNTVTIDGLNQTRYEFHKRKFKIRGPEPVFQLLGFGERDGYSFVRGSAASHEYPALHEREIRMVGGTRFIVIDELRGTGVHRYEQIFHLAPGARPHVHIAQMQPCEASEEQGWVSPTYGIRHAAPVLKFARTGSNVRFETHIEVIP